MLFFSNCINQLSKELTENFINNKQTQVNWILLSNRSQKKWLIERMVHHAPQQAWLGAKIVTWREALAEQCSLAGDKIPTSWELYSWLMALLEQEPLPPVFHFLKKTGSNHRSYSQLWNLATQLQEVMWYGNPQTDWQHWLFEKLAATWRLPMHLLPEIKGNGDSMHAFCLDDLPSCGWDFLLSRPNTSCYLFSPCSMFWSDICSQRQKQFLIQKYEQKKASEQGIEALEETLSNTHPLLANLGKWGRSILNRLGERSFYACESYHPPEESTLLARIQRDLLSLRSTQDAYEPTELSPDDSLLCIQAGASLIHELTILKEKLLTFLSSNASYQNILILAPDIRLYAPLIPFVFGKEFPYSISCIDAFASNSYIQAISLFLDWVETEDPETLLTLLGNASFQKNHPITLEEQEEIQTYLHLKKQHKPYSLAPNLIALQELLYTQRSCLLFSYPLQKWGPLLQSTISTLFSAEEGEEILFQNWLRDLVLPNVTENFCLGVLRASWNSVAMQQTVSKQASERDALTFSSIALGAVTAVDFLYVLGLAAENFPRSPSAHALQWSCIPQADLDRYLFLQILFAAKKSLILSYCHLSSDDGKLVEWAHPIEELIHLVSLYYPSYPQNTLVVAPRKKAPWNPCSKARDLLIPFVKNKVINSTRRQHKFVSLERATIAERQGASEDQKFIAKLPQSNRTLFFTNGITQPSCLHASISWKELLQLAHHPWKYRLQKQHGLFLNEDLSLGSQQLHYLKISTWKEQRYLERTFQEPLAQVKEEYAQELTQGTLGTWALTRFEHKFHEWNRHLQKWGIKNQTVSTLEVNCSSASSKGPIRLFGSIERTVPSGLLIAGELSFINLLQHWPAILGYLVHYQRDTLSLYSLSSGRMKTWKKINAQKALCKWLDYTEKALSSFSPLIAPWADAFLRKEEKEWQTLAAQPIDPKDLYIEWVLDRYELVPSLREEWHEFLQEVLSDFLTQV